VNTVQTRNRLVAAVLLLVVLLWAGLVDPNKGYVSTCLFLEETGHPCPTCGMSRSFYATFNLDFPEAFKFHLLGPVLYLILLIVFFKFSVELTSGRKIQLGLNSRNLIHLCYIFALLMMLNWLYVLLYSTAFS
jgi:hypothetical protein